MQLGKNGPKWPNMVQNDLNFPEILEIAPNYPKKWANLIQHDSQKPNIAIWGSCWRNVWQLLEILGILGKIWTIWDHLRLVGPFSHNCTGAHMNDQKSKYSLDYKMLSCMVQENHWL